MKYVDSLLGGRRVVGLGGSRGLAWVGRGAVLVEEGSIVEIEVEEAVVPCIWERIWKNPTVTFCSKWKSRCGV